MPLLIDPGTQEQLQAFTARPRHAVLLAGQTGLGKTHVARTLAADILGTPIEDSPNAMVLKPVKGVIPIDAVRNLIKFFLLRPAQADTRRIGIIYDADAMGSEAQNALLKLLEEPPAGVYLILTTSDPDRLLPTIHSRLTQISVRVPSLKSTVSYFAQQGMPAAAVAQAYQRGGGSVAHIAGKSQSEADADREETLVAQIKQLLTGTPFDRLCLVEKMSKDRKYAEQLVMTLVRMSRISLEQAGTRGNSKVLSTWQRITEAGLTAQAALEKRANVKLVLTDLMLSL